MSRIFHIGVDLQPKVGILGAVWPAESEDKVLGTDSGSFSRYVVCVREV